METCIYNKRMKKQILKTFFGALFFLPTFFMLPSFAQAAAPVINQIANTSSATGVAYTVNPTLSSGANVSWRKEYGPDDMTVDKNTGAVSWNIPANLPREAFHLGVRATNSEGSVYITWILKVGGGNFVYVDGNAVNDNGDGTVSNPKKYISSGINLMASGDTLIIKDGTYTGNSNMITNIGYGFMAPSGSPGIYTTVMAEHPGGVLIDAQHARAPIYGNGNQVSRDGNPPGGANVSYIAFKGLIATNPLDLGSSEGSITFNHVHHIKIVDCGAYEADDYTTPISVSRSEYVLVEGCYVWGNGRMKIVFYLTDYSIMRRNVARHDRSITIWPTGIFDVYASQHTRIQNNIAIDSDQFDFYGHSDAVGAFVDQSGGGNNEIWATRIDNSFWNNIALNVHNRFTLTQRNDSSDPVSFNNSIGWDMNAIANNSADGLGSAIIESSDKLNINQSTFGHWRSPHYVMSQSSGTATPLGISGYDQTQNITNSIFYDFKDYNNGVTGLFESIENAAYNNVFGPSPVNIKNSTVTNTIVTNPTTDCLKYLPRIEAGCALQTAGQTGARVGANILYMRGKSGTMFGDTDYDTEGTAPMWPFPHEDLIKTKMASYSYTGSKYTGGTGTITGARGFAAGTSLDGSPQTLTKYIWEYLGNPIPADIYGTSSDTTPPAAPTGLTVS